MLCRQLEDSSGRTDYNLCEGIPYSRCLIA
jgi:hypothetical protein